MLHILQRHWFLALLAAVLGVGLWQGPALAAPMSRLPRGWLVAGVMFLTALPMAFAQFTAVVRQARALGLALGLSILVAPPLAWLVGRLLHESLSLGLLIAAAVPCTLASAAVWTRRGGGNDAIALCVTLVTNLACFVVMPMWLWLLARAEISGGLDAIAMSQRLLLLVVAPVALAQLLRISKPVAATATRFKPQLSIAAQLGVLVMVLVGAVSAGDTLHGLGPEKIAWATWWMLLIAVLVVHLALFVAGWWGGRSLGLAPADRLAVAISGSQKTLMVGLDIALGFGGLAVLPMVAYHVVQLIVDTVLVDWLRPVVLENDSKANRC